LATTEAGSGPFQLVSYTPGTRLVLKPRPSYAHWSGQTDPAKQITVNFVTSDTTMLLDAQSGSVDLTYGLSKRSVKSLEGDGKVTLNKAPAGSLQELMLSWYSPPFDKPAVREAVTLAVPYQQLLSTAAVGYGRLFYGPLIPGMEFFDPKTTPPVTPNIAKAKQLLVQAGVKTPLNVTLTTLAGNTEQEQIATLLQAGLKQIGINLAIAPLTTTAFTNAQYAFKVQAALQEDGPAVFSAPFYLGYTMKCSDPSLGPNLIKMCIPQADRLIDQANAEQNPATRQQLYNQITQIWRTNWSWIPLYSEEDVTVMRKGICGYVHYPHYLDLRGIGAC
jgi:peptide/nickel transport system substrate-binding protein